MAKSFEVRQRTGMTRRSFFFHSSNFEFRDSRWLSSLALIVTGISIFFQATATGALSSQVSNLLQLACLAGVGYVAVSFRNFIEMEDRARTIPMSLASDLQFFEIYRHYAEAISKIADIPDPAFRNAALQQLATIGHSLQNLGEGMLTFENTESWRLIYEQILRSNHVYSYKSNSAIVRMQGIVWIKKEVP